MGIKDIAEDFAALCKAGQHEEAGARYWAEEVVSREAMEGPMAEMRGVAAVREKSAWWFANHEVHSATTEGPFVHGDQFALRFEMDVTAKQTGQRLQMAEIGLYTVKDGKVVEERFFY
ncbi:nuclear transport factor 2 family protein [Falsiroseomonas selenitidurans]|uniref:Nuclear transport factor 2 family protein n=1 Tax=Falsiroseomonas selenitidurans TaxID=2716335 RepID=A0ABX1DYP5_9PROT|nr:nuclear transport factor 2 family protein [Falsiroseomonas selenitidurans]NKC30009.1 nuclear transport factor 2 family protein [Falsiroseomonas selenitidurans]